MGRNIDYTEEELMWLYHELNNLVKNKNYDSEFYQHNE